MASDAIGEALDFEDEKAILAYFEKPDYFPTNRLNPSKTGSGGYNTELCLCAIRSLDDINPVELEDIRFFVDAFVERTIEKEKILLSYKKKIYALNGNDYANSLPIAIATGTYSSLQGTSTMFSLRLYDSACTVYGITNEIDLACGRCLCYLVSYLLKTGYFGIEAMQLLHDLNFYTDAFYKVVDEILAHPLEADYLNGYISDEALNGLSYFELILADVFFHMARVDTAYRPNVLKSPPSAQWALMLPRATVDLSDVCFAYGAVCGASEHTKPVITKQLRESTPSFEYLKTLLK